MANARWWSGALLCAATVLTAARGAHASIYPTNSCVSAKVAAAGTQCSAVLKAWSRWDKRQDAARRDETLARAAARFTEEWEQADQMSAASGVDCAQTTLSAAAMVALIDGAASAAVAEINAGLDLAGSAADGRCGSSLLKSAARRCRRVLWAEGVQVRSPGSDRGGLRLERVKARVSAQFAATWTRVTAGGCPTTATLGAAETQLDAISEGIVANSTISPNVATAWTMVTPPTQVAYQGQTLQPICARGTPYAFFVRRGTVNKLLMYYQGGGACWSYYTCHPFLGAFDDDVNPAEDDPGLVTTGFADLSNPDNPFRDWNAVFVSYCTGDVHWGDAHQTYVVDNQLLPIEHRGFINAQVAEKWAREHFVNPEEVFVAGSSAGAYGAILHALYLREGVYPGSRFNVVGDAGNGVITQGFLQNNIARWGIEQHLPTWIPELNQPIAQLSIDRLWSAGAGRYSDDRFAQYTSAYDGGLGSQSMFYNIMLNPGNIPVWLQWWLATCQWHQQMRALALTTATDAPTNYRYYIGAGSRHTVWGSNKVYTDTTGGVPPLVGWLAAMRGDGMGWTNVECADCSLLPGTCSDNPATSCHADSDCLAGTCQDEDPRPDPLVAPFGPGGTVTCP